MPIVFNVAGRLIDSRPERLKASVPISSSEFPASTVLRALQSVKAASPIVLNPSGSVIDLRA